MKIQKVTNEEIIFDNGNTISYGHAQDCFEHNYADFSILDEHTIDYDYNFDEDLIFETIPELGFKFGSNGRWIFIPCYSEQSGYYTDEINIYYKNQEVLSFSAQEIIIY